MALNIDALLAGVNLVDGEVVGTTFMFTWGMCVIDLRVQLVYFGPTLVYNSGPTPMAMMSDRHYLGDDRDSGSEVDIGIDMPIDIEFDRSMDGLVHISVYRYVSRST